jgi:hypothetical protein
VRSRIVPESAAGRWALGLFDVAAVAFAVMTVVAATGEEPREILSHSWWLGLPAFVGGFSMLLSTVVGAYAVLRLQERAVLVLVTTGIGMIAVIYFFGEVLRPGGTW